MLTLVLNRMVFARLLASDFPSENPRTQTRTFHTFTVVANLKTKSMGEKEEKMKNKVDELRKSLFRADTPNKLQSVFINYKQVSELIGENFGEGNDYIETDIETAMKSKLGNKSESFRNAYDALLQNINEIPI